MTTQQVLEHIDADWIAEQTERLVRVPSVTLEEQEVCRLYEQQLRELGLDVDVREVTPGRPNLYARIAGSGDGPTLMLNGHLDTIAEVLPRTILLEQAVFRIGKRIDEAGIKGRFPNVQGPYKGNLEHKDAADSLKRARTAYPLLRDTRLELVHRMA